MKGQKELGKDNFTKIPNGLPGTEHRPALVYTYGVLPGRITREQMAALLSENAAKQFGMYPKKGALLPGSDADIVVWDPAAGGVITAESQHQNVDYTPYEGFKVEGCAKAVYLRGQKAAENGEIVLPLSGRYISRGKSLY
jgi:dihydropyrimidinase